MVLEEREEIERTKSKLSARWYYLNITLANIIVFTSVFDALSIGSSLRTAVFLCIKRGLSEVE